MKNYKKKEESGLVLFVEAFLTIVAIPVGFMLALISETGKRKY